MKNTIDFYAEQAAQRHAIKIDQTFWVIVKVKPWWMPMFIYRGAIKNLIEIQNYPTV